MQLAFIDKDPVFDGNDDDVARDLSEGLLEGLRDCEKLNVIKIMGAILHPLFQNKKRMVASGICKALQYDAGRKELINQVCRVYDRLSSTDSVHLPAPIEHALNQWSSDEYEEDVLYVSPNNTLAEEELAKYESYNKYRFQPQLNPTKTLE